MRVFRFIVLLLSLSFVAAPGFAGEPRTPARPAPARSAQVATFGQALRGLLTSLWGADGCGYDPLGRCNQAAVPTTDKGCGIDPLGGCSQSALPTTDKGCAMDPLGSCK